MPRPLDPGKRLRKEWTHLHTLDNRGSIFNSTGLLATLAHPHASAQRIETDTISIGFIQVADELSDLLPQLPEAFQIRDFCIVVRLRGIDPAVSFNKGTALSTESLALIRRMQPGDHLEVKRVNGYRSATPDRIVKLPERRYVVK